ncbi:MAG: hypothetical protein AAFU85_27975 [Planctomycetota bacterium]
MRNTCPRAKSLSVLLALLCVMVFDFRALPNEPPNFLEISARAERIHAIADAIDIAPTMERWDERRRQFLSEASQ